MKKEMFKKVKAAILSVFVLGVVLFQCADAVSVMAADSLFSGPSDEHYSSIKNISSLNDYIGLSGDNALTSNDFIFVAEANNNLYVYAMRKVDSEKRNVKISNTFYYYLNQFLNLRGYVYSDSDSSLEKYEYKYLWFYVDSQNNYKKCQVTGDGRDTFWVKQSTNTSSNRFEINRTFSTKITEDAHVVHLIFSNASSLACNGTNYNTGFSGVLGDIKYTASDDECGFGDFLSGGSGGSSGSYDNELGHLQNIKYTALKTGNSSNTGDSDYRFKVSYSLKTSTGVSLKDEGVGVQWLVKLKGGYETLMGEYNSLPTVNSSYYHIMDKSNHFYIDSGLYNDLVNEFRTSDVPFTASLKYTTYIYCRPYRFSSSGNTYGLWSRIDNKGGVTTINNGTTSTGDVSKESDGEDDDFISESTSTNKPEFGSGTDWDDAESNAGPTDSIGTVIGNNFNFGDVLSIFNSFKSGLGEFIKAMGDFPQLIAKTFPFLPTFITSAIGLGFLMAVVLRLLGR